MLEGGGKGRTISHTPIPFKNKNETISRSSPENAGPVARNRLTNTQSSKHTWTSPRIWDDSPRNYLGITTSGRRYTNHQSAKGGGGVRVRPPKWETNKTKKGIGSKTNDFGKGGGTIVSRTNGGELCLYPHRFKTVSRTKHVHKQTRFLCFFNGG